MTREQLTAKLEAVASMEANLNAARVNLASAFFGEDTPMRALIGVDIDTALLRASKVRLSLQSLLEAIA